jgi:hypothetical protein
MSVLEPSAGNGAIADELANSGAKVTAIEPVQRLREILGLKGPTLAEDSDFLHHQGGYDRIVMNPPFERGQDMDHVRHAFDLLKPGGKLVAIMSEGSFSRGDKKATEFRAWREQNSGSSEKLPAGSFTGKDSQRQTGVATRMVVLEKPALANTSERPIIESHVNKPESGAKGQGETLPEPRGSGNSGRYGDATQVRIPGENRALEARYAVRELADVHPSHNPVTLQANPVYAYRNDRNYADPRNSGRIIKQVAEFDPSYLLTESPDAVNGAPIIDRDGNVLGGNSRTMTVSRVYDERPAAATEYKAMLEKKAAQFGLDRKTSLP